MAHTPPPSPERPRVAALVGPTAVGKTAVALELAAACGAEIVNADSLQIYRELDIGTAKPTPEERARLIHHLIDVADPPEPYDAARFCCEGRDILAACAQRSAPPLVVGGTGLYLKALLSGLFAEGEPAPGVRARLRRELGDLGLPALYARLLHLDPATAARLHPHDTYRIIRALEVMEVTGRPLSEFIAAHRFKDAPFTVLKLGLTRDREELNRRIELRMELMLAAGWLEEVAGLLTTLPPGPQTPAGHRLPAPHQPSHRALEPGRGPHPAGPGYPALRQTPGHLVCRRPGGALVSPGRGGRHDGPGGRVLRVRSAWEGGEQVGLPGGSRHRP